MTKIHMKLVTAFWCGLAVLSAPATECARMRVPDSLKSVLRPNGGWIGLPVPGGGHVWVTNYNCGDGTDENQAVPVPVHTAAAWDAAIHAVPEDRLILAEISGTTLFAFQEEFNFDWEIDGEPMVAFGGVAIVKGYFFRDGYIGAKGSGSGQHRPRAVAPDHVPAAGGRQRGTARSGAYERTGEGAAAEG